MKFFLLLLSGLILLPGLPAEARSKTVRIDGATFRPPYPTSQGEEEIHLPAFELDRRPVTNGEFLSFVRKNPTWQRGEIPGIFADERYLSHWQSPTSLGDRVDPDQPVTMVSWFAARAYCRHVGARLPKENEWELVALASETKADASGDSEYFQKILGWYSKPTPKVLPKVGQGVANFHGVHDLHGLVWEWVADFGMTMVSSDSREGGSLDETRFCGGTAITQGDKEDYARFMRYAYRSALQAKFTVANLGFRCAKDAKVKS